MLFFVMDSTQSHSAADSAMYGIQCAHNLAGIPSPTDSPKLSSEIYMLHRLKSQYRSSLTH